MKLPPYSRHEDGTPAKPHEKQRAFHQLKARYRYLLGGLGSGKTCAGSRELMRQTLQNAEYLTKTQRPMGARYLIGAPTDELVVEGAWTQVQDWLTDFEVINGASLIDHVWNSPQRRQIRLVTGDLLIFKTLHHADRIAASNCVLGWFDECELSDDPLGGFKGLLRRVGRDPRFPMARRGIICTSTPWTPRKGETSSLHKHFRRKIAQGDTNYGIVTASSLDNPGLREGYVEDNSAAMTDREVEELIHGRPQAEEGAIYAREFADVNEPDDSMVDWRAPDLERYEYTVAIDWGAHYHALLIEHRPNGPDGRPDPLGGEDLVFDEVIRDGVQDEEFLDAVVERLQRWGIPKRRVKVWSDYNPADAVDTANRPEYFDRRVYAQRVDDGEDKREGISTVRWRLRDSKGRRRLRFARRLLEHTNSRRIIACMSSYRWETLTVAGNVVHLPTVNQKSIYSHGADALRYYCWPRYHHLRQHVRRAA